jgi:hypothetical protein
MSKAHGEDRLQPVDLKHMRGVGVHCLKGP